MNVEVILTTGQTLEHFGVSDKNIDDLRHAFYNWHDEVFKIIDSSGESFFRIRDVTAICINNESQINRVGFKRR